MNDKAKRFGGELEYADVEVKTSTYKGRQLFFEIIYNRKPQVFSELLNLYNPTFVSQEFQNNLQSINLLINLFVRNLATRALFEFEWSEFNFKPEIVQTPIVYYFDYLSKKKAELKEFAAKGESEFAKHNYQGSEKSLKEVAIKGLIPNWKTVSQDVEAKLLCESLINWAEKFNLHEDWILDFALINLRHFKIILDGLDLPNIDLSNQNWFLDLELDRWKSKVRNESLNSYIWEGRDTPAFEFHLDIDNHPAFNFCEFGFNINDSWQGTHLGFFMQRVERGFFLQSKQKLALINNSTYSLAELTKELLEMNLAIKNFNSELKKYCSEVRKILPEGFVKTPVKKSGEKHFEWLVDFQITNPVVKSSEEIAREHNVDGKAVRSGVESVAKIIGLLNLRDAPHTGRPKGVKETKRRGNYRHW